MIRLVEDLWTGRVPLADAFWTYTILWGFFINMAATLVSLALVVADAPSGAAVAAHVAPIPWNVLTAVAVWRSAAWAPVSPGWATAARLVALGWAVVLSVA